MTGSSPPTAELQRSRRLPSASASASASATATATASSLRPAVFLDKDGTLVIDVPYNVDPSKLRFSDHAVDALLLLQQAGYALVVVTNQAGIALGRFTRQAFAQLELALTRQLAEQGVRLDGIYLCPHRADGAGAASCLCRKPAPGMLRQAALAHRLDLERSWMVGDILDDVEAGHRAGCRSVLLDVGNETIWRMSPLREPDHRCADLLEAARVIVACGHRPADAVPSVACSVPSVPRPERVGRHGDAQVTPPA